MIKLTNDERYMLHKIALLEDEVRLLEDDLKKSKDRQARLEHYIVTRRKLTPKQKIEAKKNMAIFLNGTIL